MNEFLLLLRVLTTPSIWLRPYRIDKFWDQRIRMELEQPKFKNIKSHTVEMNGLLIWVANHPYASVSNYRFGGESNGLPTRRTVLLFRDALDRHLAEVVYE